LILPAVHSSYFRIIYGSGVSGLHINPLLFRSDAFRHLFYFGNFKDKLKYMSTAEMKILVIEKLAALNDEAAVNAVNDFLDRLSKEGKEPAYNLSQHFIELSKRYDETLKKLAQ
jgi:hypothetical protein